MWRRRFWSWGGRVAVPRLRGGGGERVAILVFRG